MIDQNGSSIKIGNTKLDKEGLTIKSPDNNTSKNVKLTDKGLNNGGNKITNVADGTEASDAATVGQLKNIAAKAGVVKESGNKEDWAKKDQMQKVKTQFL